MERQFQRADFEDLMGDDALLDGTELSCGFVRIEASGIYSTYRPARGEEPLFDTNVFKREDLVLPFRFTLEQFKAFCAWHRAFKWDVIDLEFTNSFCSWHPLFRGKASDSFNYPPDDDALLELKGRNQSSAVLVLGILGIADADEYFVCKLREFNDQSETETMVEVAANEKPEPPAPPVVGADASGGVAPDKAGLVDKGWVMKKAALIDKHADKWKTINGDFHSASENGLSKAAKAPGHGDWFEAAALYWAEQRGKLKKGEEEGPNNLATVWTGKKHTIQG